MENEREILKLKDAIHDCNQRIKILDMELDEKSFKHRCVPQKRNNAKSMIVKVIVPLIILTALAVVGMIRAVSCLQILLKIGSANGAGLGIELLAFLIVGGFSCWGGIKLWIYVIRQTVLVHDLNVSEKKLEAEIRSLNDQIKDLQKGKAENERRLEAEEREKYLREMSPDAELNIENLRKYLDAKFGGIKNIENRIGAPEVINELWRFGYRTIGDMEVALADTPAEYYVPYDITNYAGVLRNIMIIKDCHTYFTEAYRGGWLQTTYERMKFWKMKGVTNIEAYLRDNKIELKQY